MAHKLANEGDDNDVVANRYYFSCFQKLLHLAQTEFQNSKKDNDKSSHTSLIFCVEEEINKAMRDEKKECN
ncbi:hypothetical protein GZH82_10740 [Staphylococcus ursi]|uniref:hypothetical protein n=1 Tax=Staphylococcus sp. MI 10-1553 TaxID=1912064 RepID=UPI0013990085|nr:hypothetical protein [Staphylococcus sp. MI 10-1553]QHW37779.1 hypothetical protein GZH82_10740 [Staphylococcus sp. MI 10-1553]